MAKKKFYAVKKGVTPGIYENWPQAEAQVKGFPGARFKGFASRQDAVAWLKGELETTAVSQKKKDQQTVLPVLRKGEVLIFTDGGAINNPGPGGYGAIIVRYDGEEELCGGFRLTTNNRMELMACIIALRKLQSHEKNITLYSDSSYVVNGMTKGWVQNWRRNGWVKADKKPVLNQDLWQKMLDLTEGINIVFKWVKGHAGNPLNERCDKLAVQSAKGVELSIDNGYEQTQ